MSETALTGNCEEEAPRTNPRALGLEQTRTPVYMLWIKKASYVAFGYAALVKNEFDGLRLNEVNDGPVDGVNFIPKNINSSLSISMDIAILFCILIGIRVFAYLLIRCIIVKGWL